MPAPGKRARQRANKASAKLTESDATEAPVDAPPVPGTPTDTPTETHTETPAKTPLDPAAELIASLKEYSADLALDNPLAAEALKHGVRLGFEIGERRTAVRFQEMGQAVSTFMESCERRFDSTHDAAYAMGVAAERALWTPNPTSPGLPSLPSPFVDQSPSISELYASLALHFPHEIPPALDAVIKELRAKSKDLSKHERRLQMFEEMSFLRGKEYGILEERARHATQSASRADPAAASGPPPSFETTRTFVEMETQTDSAAFKQRSASSESATQTEPPTAAITACIRDGPSEPTTQTNDDLDNRFPMPTTQISDPPFPLLPAPAPMLLDNETPQLAGNDTPLDWADDINFDTDTKSDRQRMPSARSTSPTFVRDFSELRSARPDPWESIHHRKGRHPRQPTSRTQRNFRRAREYDRIRHIRRPDHFPMLICSCMHTCPVARERHPTVPDWRMSSRTQRGRCY